MRPPKGFIILVLSVFVLLSLGCHSWRPIPIPGPGTYDKLRVRTKDGEVYVLRWVQIDSVTLSGDPSRAATLGIPLERVGQTETEHFDVLKTAGLAVLSVPVGFGLLVLAYLAGV